MINVFLFYILMSYLFASQSSQKKIPIVRWGQNSHQLMMIVSIPSNEKEEVKFNDNNIYISSTNKEGESYELNLNLLRQIIPEKCSYDILEIGLKLKVYKKTKEPCWKRLTKEQNKNNLLIKDKKLGDANDCEEAKDVWFEEYKFHKRKTNPQKIEKAPKRGGVAENIIGSLKDQYSNFSLHEF